MKALASSAAALVALAIPLALVAQPASTQTTSPQNPACGDRNQIVASLGMQYREKQQAIGVVDSNTLLEVFVSQQGTWTIVATDPEGLSCIVFYGEGWDSKVPIADANA